MTRLAIRSPYGRQPLGMNRARQQIGVNAKIPPPVGGWDTQSPLTAMPSENAVRLDNFVPRQGYVEMRKGTASHALSLGGPVQSLMVWRGPTSEKLMAANSLGDIYDVTNPGAGVKLVNIGQDGSGYWQYVNFGTPGGHFIRAVNGINTSRIYNGTSWTVAPAITGSGIGSDEMIDVFAHKQRLYFIQADTTKFWYLDPIAIGGTAKPFDLATIFNKGGHLVSGATWSIDGGSGPDDMAVFISSEGQVAVYQGIDPSSANDWAIVGAYDIPKPITQRCFIKLGADLGVLTEAGLIPLRASLVGVSASNSPDAISAKVANAFLSSARQFGVNNLWQATVYARDSVLIINVPKTTSGLTHQYVMDLTTGSWCRYVGISANCFAIFRGLLYFGSNGAVALADTGHQDGTSPIVGDMVGAFSDFRRPGLFKHFTTLRPVLRSASSAEPSAEMVTDFADVPVDTAPIQAQTDANWPTALWDEAIWGVSRWGVSQNVHMTAAGAKGLGIYGAARLRMATQDDSEAVGVTTQSTLQVLGFDTVFQQGGTL